MMDLPLSWQLNHGGMHYRSQQLNHGDNLFLLISRASWQMAQQ